MLRKLGGVGGHAQRLLWSFGPHVRLVRVGEWMGCPSVLEYDDGWLVVVQ